MYRFVRASVENDHLYGWVLRAYMCPDFLSTDTFQCFSRLHALPFVRYC